MPLSNAWSFRRFAPGDNLSDPDFAKALFSGDQESALSRSLVREAIQNSLDAKRDDAEHVLIRITLMKGRTSVLAAAAAPFTAGLHRHLESQSSGLVDRPALNDPLPCLVLEDFGTHGLRGDPEHWQPVNVQGNGFFLFFRALGRSGKADEDRGRWGVGKFVFPMASRAHAIWALTVPSDTRRPLLMGRAVLATHEVGDDSYHPDGHWGLRGVADSNFISPVADSETMNRFIDAFSLSRRGEPGLSVVVPWLLDEIEHSDIAEAVVGEYFLPLLRNQLRVVVRQGDAVEALDGAAVERYSQSASNPLLRARLDLARRIAEGRASVVDWPQDFTYQDTEWRSEAIPSDLLEQLRVQLERGDAVSVRLRTTIRRKNPDGSMRGEATVHLMHVEGLGAARPLIVREGISISMDRTRAVHDYVGIITADQGPLATLLGDAETPAHEELKHNLLRDKYVLPKKTVVFIRESVSQLLKAIWEADKQDDPLLLAGYFPFVSDSGRTGERPDKRARGDNEEPKPTIPHSPARYHVSRIDGGFRVRSNPENSDRPSELSVRVAYDVRRGSPFKRYRKYDFDLSTPPMVMSLVGCEVVESSDNALLLRTTSDSFVCEVTGFDPKRDLIIRVTATSGAA